MKTYVEVPNTHTDTVIADRDVVRTVAFESPRRRWPGIVAALVIGGGIAALAVSSFYDGRTVGQRLDTAVSAGENKVNQKVDDLRSGASQAARGGAEATQRVASALGDTGITASVKTALAADPSLSALKIDVTTNNGVVSLVGPAPDEKSRARAEVLAAAPEGVTRVDNQLIVGAAKTTN